MNPLATLLDRDYLLDVQELRKEFAEVDTTDPASLRRWFADHPYLAANDHARIAGVCLKTVRRWQDRAGLPCVGRQRPPGWRRPRQLLAAPLDWTAGTWLEDSYAEGHGIRAIARAIGRSYTATRRQLRRRGVAFRPARAAVRSRHPCCNRPWLLRHYVVEGLSLSRCARLAGVSAGTMTGWLLAERIRIRSNSEQQALQHEAGVGPACRPAG
jgi:transposase